MPLLGPLSPTFSPYLTTTEAATYLRYRSASAIRNLIGSGRPLLPVGGAARTSFVLRTWTL